MCFVLALFDVTNGGVFWIVALGPAKWAIRAFAGSAHGAHQTPALARMTNQQAHKYERGINRVSAGRLFEIARALSAPITYFYEGMAEEGQRQSTLRQRMQLEIARNFAEISNEKHQEAVSQLARALASG